MTSYKYYMKRWFILISAKSVSPFYSDEKILQNNQLPPWMDLDTLYYFKIKNKDDIGQAKGKVILSEVLEITEKDMTSSKEEGFSFIINVGKEIF